VPTPASPTDPPLGPPHRPAPTQPPEAAPPPTPATPGGLRTGRSAPCGCDCCAPGGFCGGCGHRGCGGRTALTAPAIRVIEATELQPGDVLRLKDNYTE